MSQITPDWEQQLEEAAAPEQELSRNDRFSGVLVVLVFAILFAVGLVLRQRDGSQNWTYESREAGISAVYPAGWLSDSGPDYVMRFRDPDSRPFKTQFIVRTIPVTGENAANNVLNTLTVQRGVDLAAYRILNVETTTQGETTQVRVSFAFVDSDPNPYIQRLPAVVLGEDRIFFSANRALIVTYMAGEEKFAAYLPVFERFLDNLTY